MRRADPRATWRTWDRRRVMPMSYGGYGVAGIPSPEGPHEVDSLEGLTAGSAAMCLSAPRNRPEGRGPRARFRRGGRGRRSRPCDHRGALTHQDWRFGWVGIVRLLPGPWS